MKGKIIAITGGPRGGKSTLVKLLADHYQGAAFLEGEEKDFPPRIIEDIASGSRLVELMLWFRNHIAEQYVEATRVKDRGRAAVLDCFWLTNQTYIDAWVSDPFERQVLTELTDLDTKTFTWPDVVIVLTQQPHEIREFVRRGGRSFENDEEYFKRQLKIHEQHEQFFRSISETHPNIHFLDRTGLDFLNNAADFKRVTALIETEDAQ